MCEDKFYQEKSMQTESSRMEKFPEDSVIIREGEVRNEMYKIVSGKAAVYINYGEKMNTCWESSLNNSVLANLAFYVNSQACIRLWQCMMFWLCAFPRTNLIPFC